MKPPAMRRAVSGDHRSLPTRTVGQSIGVGAGTAAVHEDEVVLVRERLFDAAEDRAVVGEFLAAGAGVVPAAVAASPAQPVLALAGYGVRLSATARFVLTIRTRQNTNCSDHP